jgi:hypothetical protein
LQLPRLAEGLGLSSRLFPPFWVLYWPGDLPDKGASPEKASWLNVGFLFARNGAGLLLLTLLCMALIFYSVRADREFLTRPAGSADLSGGKPWRVQRVLSPIIGILYAFILSLLAFDLIMSLDPHWYSTLFGAYYFMSSFYAALAALVLISHLFRRSHGLQEYIHPHHLHDLGKLLFAFCLFTGYLFYVQFLVIWYANLPRRKYIILRVALLLGAHGMDDPGNDLHPPFLVLLRRKWKMNPAVMIPVSLVVLGGCGWSGSSWWPLPLEGKSSSLAFWKFSLLPGFRVLSLSLTAFLGKPPLTGIRSPLPGGHEAP